MNVGPLLRYLPKMTISLVKNEKNLRQPWKNDNILNNYILTNLFFHVNTQDL